MLMTTPQEYWDDVFLSGKDFALINNLFLDRILIKIKNNKTPKEMLTALDIGCGTGDLLKKLADRSFVVDGVDASAAALEEARNRLGDHAGKLLCLDLDREMLKETQEHYNLITMKLVLAFINNKAKLLDEIKTKLAPSGTFFLITPIINETMTLVTQKAQAISIPENEVEELLNTHFGSWELINKEQANEGLLVASYLAWA